MGFTSPDKPSRGPSQLSEGPSLAACYTGVQTFLRIRPSSSPSSGGPPTTRCLALWSRNPNSVKKESGGPGGPPLKGPYAGGPCPEGPPTEPLLSTEAPEGTAAKEPPTPEGALGAPVSFAAGCNGEQQQGLRGLLSLAAGRSRAQTSSLQQDGEGPCLKPQSAPVSSSTPLRVQQPAAVVLLPPGGGTRAPAAQQSANASAKKGWGPPLNPKDLPYSRTINAPERLYSEQSRPPEVPKEAAARQQQIYLKSCAGPSKGPPVGTPERLRERPLVGSPGGAIERPLVGAPGGPLEGPPVGPHGGRSVGLMSCCLGDKGCVGPFRFDGVFEEDSSQESLFKTVGRPAAEAVLRGVSACIAV